MTLAHQEEPPVQIKLLSDNAKAPFRATPYSAGFDLYSAQDVTIEANGKAIIPLDISIAIPHGYYGRMAPRSSLAAKNHLDVGAGVIDADYRGPLGVVMFNFGKNDYEVKKGDRVAQLVIEKIWTGEMSVVEELGETVRGSGGFGSTGRN